MNNNIYGLTGLINQGNTCYMNSILQCLSNCKDFRNFILNKEIIHILNNSDNIYVAKKKLDNTLTFQLKRIFSYLWFNDYKVIELSSFRKIFCKKIQMFQNFNQHDSQEALLCIIDTIHEEIAQKYQIIPNNKDILFDSLRYRYKNENDLENYIFDIINDDISKYLNFKSFIDFEKSHKNYSKIYDIFEGRTISQLKCPVTNLIKANFNSEFYFTLSLDNDYDESSISNESTSSSNSIEENDEENELSYEEHNSNDEENELSFDNSEDNHYKSDNEENEFSCDNSEDNDYKSDNEFSYEEENSTNEENESNDQDSSDKSIEYESNEYDFDYNDYSNIFKKVKKCNIYDLFDNFVKVEILDNDNQWFSPYCQKKVNAEKVNLIWDSPKVFIILIKRFEYTEYGAEKLNHLVNFPIYDLDITKYLHPNHVSKYTKYNLFAINNHDSMNSNGINFGHYYSYCKNSSNGKWYNFDDDDVDEISENEIVTNKAYMLFYEAIN